MRVEVESVNVGAVALLMERNGKSVYSSIAKSPVAVEAIYLTPTGLAGDQQADTRLRDGRQAHGGHEQAVYAYPAEHFGLWARELGQEIGPGAFGENLTIRGVTEDEARIGEIWKWGEARLQVASPRGPCVKLDYHRGRPKPSMIERMIENGRCGWYLRVLEPGVVPVGGPISVLERPGGAETVAAGFRAQYPASVRG